ncbi:hypothetical protein [[Actinomadura] parvosata]|nr:hypothetical protein [Nonomuraea sp. ATCC 55076]
MLHLLGLPLSTALGGAHNACTGAFTVTPAGGLALALAAMALLPLLARKK